MMSPRRKNDVRSVYGKVNTECVPSNNFTNAKCTLRSQDDMRMTDERNGFKDFTLSYP